MIKKLWFVFVILEFMLSACILGNVNLSTVTGSGTLTSETRSVTGFTGIDLRGSANVDVTIGSTENVVVKADDNIVPLIETFVQSGVLVIRTKNNTNVTTRNPVSVTVTMKSLNELILSGSGNIDVHGINGDGLNVSLPGSGNITVSGIANSLTVNLSGSGTIECSDLHVNSVNARITGSGNIYVFASQSLDASIVGSGTIRYSGNPAQVNKSITGSGSINP
jgi:hypothetical protein